MRARLSICQCRYDVTQGRQTLIDLLGLLEALTRGLRHAHSLTTGQIDEVQLADLDLLRHVIAVVLRSSGLPV